MNLKSNINKYSKTSPADWPGTRVDTPGVTIEERAKVSKPASHVLTVMKEERGDISKNLQTQLTQEMLDNYDKVIVMAEHETIPKWLRSDPKFEYWEITDAGWEKRDEIRDVREKIKHLVLNLLQK